MNVKFKIQNETLHQQFPQSYLLARQAKREKRLTGKIKVKCPKCQEKPTITTSAKGERTYVECKCGYIYSEDINF